MSFPAIVTSRPLPPLFRRDGHGIHLPGSNDYISYDEKYRQYRDDNGVRIPDYVVLGAMLLHDPGRMNQFYPQIDVDTATAPDTSATLLLEQLAEVADMINSLQTKLSRLADLTNQVAWWHERVPSSTGGEPQHMRRRSPLPTCPARAKWIFCSRHGDPCGQPPRLHLTVSTCSRSSTEAPLPAHAQLHRSASTAL